MTHRGTVLVVDDSRSSLEVLTKVLTVAGYEVRSADSGARALASIVAQPPELILLDIRMPDMDGFEVIRRLKDQPETRDIPVLFLSAATDAEQRVEGLTLGAVDFIPKPFQGAELLARVHTHLEMFRLRARLEQQAAHLQSANVQLQREMMQRQQAQDAAAASDRKFRAILYSIGDAVITTDTAGRVREMNPVAESLTGWSELDAQGKFLGEVFSVINETTGEAQEDPASAVLRGGQPVALAEDTLLVARDGTRRPIVDSAAPIREESGAVTGVVLVFRDQTVQRAARHALSESEAQFRSLTEAALLGVVIIQDGRFRYLNPAMARMLGYSHEEMLAASSILDYVIEEDRAEVLENLRRRQEGEEESIRYVFRARRMDGSTADLEVFGSRIALAGRSAVMSTVLDITEHRKVDKALRASEARYRAVTQSANVAIISADSAGNIVGWNQGAERVFGYTEVEIMGRPLTLLMPAHQRDAHLAGVTRVRENGERHLIGRTVEVEGRHQDGSEIPLDLSLSEWQVADGHFFTAIIRDVSERKRAEAELRLQSAALNAAANPIVITDRGGTILWVNRAFTRGSGYAADEAIGKNPRELFKSGVHDQAFYKNLWDTLLAGDVWQGEMTNRRKDGSRYVEDLTITPVKNARGEITHFIAIKRDLTEEKQLQAQLLQSQKIESVGQLAGGIAHDFNNLLTVINGTADLALRKLRAGDPLRTDLGRIQEAGDRAASLTRQLLAFSRKQIMKPDILDLGGLVAGQWSMLQRLIGEDIDLVVVPAKGPGRVRADAGQIEQVVLNLVLNARDAMPDGGQLTIETRDVELDETHAPEHPSVQAGPHVMLAVTDTGVGMDEATRQRIFEPFFTTKEQGKGTGLGLSTVYGIVKQSGGSVWVYSEPGKGTTLKIYLPRVGEGAPKAKAPRRVMAIGGTETILIVEDEKALLELGKNILESAGYSVLPASSAEEALLLLKRHQGPVHLLLTDVVMPGMSGRDLATRLAETRPGIKVLYTSGYTDDAILRRGVLQDTAHFISKPYTIEELTRVIRETLDAPGRASAAG